VAREDTAAPLAGSRALAPNGWTGREPSPAIMGKAVREKLAVSFAASFFAGKNHGR